MKDFEYESAGKKMETENGVDTDKREASHEVNQFLNKSTGDKQEILYRLSPSQIKLVNEKGNKNLSHFFE